MTLTSLLMKKLSLPAAAPKAVETIPIDMDRVATIILGGGEGKRLAPLTHTNCKPAIHFGGKYRLIDIPLSNALNSGCKKISIITQFLSTSLHKHISCTYRPGTFSQGYIELLTAEQRPLTHSWFQGTADAIRQNLPYFAEAPVDYFLILSGDQLYNINFQEMVRYGKETHADLVIAALPVEEEEAKRMGLLKINEDGFISDFCEKPQEQALLDRMRLTEFSLKHHRANIDRRRPYLGSMGIYLFKRQALFDLLQQDPREDFGKHLIPTKVAQGNVAAYLHDGYWEDIGTIESFYRTNIALTGPNPTFNCYDERNPIYACQHHLPPAKVSQSKLEQAILCEGAIVDGAEVAHSILGPRTHIKRGSVIHRSYIMGHDFYHPPIQTERLPAKLQIDEECVIERAIIDKHVSIGKGVKLINQKKLTTYNGEGVFIRDGIIIVTRGTHLPDGFTL